MNTKSATQLLAEMDTLQAKLTGLAAIETTLKNLTVCQQCQQPLRHYQQFSHSYGECTDPNCRRFAITLELNDLAAMSEAMVNEFLAGRSS